MLELPAGSANVTFRNWVTQASNSRPHSVTPRLNGGETFAGEGSDFYSPVFHSVIKGTPAEVWPAYGIPCSVS